MPIALDPKSTWDYVLECDRGEERPTVFELKALSVRDEARLEDGHASVDRVANAIRVSTGTTNLEALRAGLVGVRDFFDADGRPVLFDTDKQGRVSDSFLERLHPDWRQELARAIADRVRLTEADRKNSPSAPAS